MSAPTPVLFDDGSKALVPPEKLSDALKDGGKVAQAMTFDDGSRAYVTLDKVHAAIHDGGQLIGTPPQQPNVNMQPDNTSAFSDNRFTVTPQPGENFGDTMRRAAQAGKTVTPAEISSQGMKGLMEAPAVGAAALGVAPRALQPWQHQEQWRPQPSQQLSGRLRILWLRPWLTTWRETSGFPCRRLWMCFLNFSRRNKRKGERQWIKHKRHIAEAHSPPAD